MIVCILALLAAAEPASSAALPVEAQVHKLLADQQAAWNRGDLEGYMAGYLRSPDLVFFSGASETRGWEPTLARYRKRYLEGGREMGALEFSELSIEPIGDATAFARGRWHLAFRDGSAAGGLFTLLLKRGPDGFRVVHDHSSGDAEAAPLPVGAALLIAGAIEKPGALSLAELEPLGEELRFTERGREHTARGVPLEKLLASRGFSAGPMGHGVAPAEKRPGYKKVVVAGAADGFQAVFSVAELSGAIGGTRALLVWQVDGKPVDAESGPLRILVTSDREPSRAVRQVDRIDVLDAGKLAPARRPK